MCGRGAEKRQGGQFLSVSAHVSPRSGVKRSCLPIGVYWILSAWRGLPMTRGRRASRTSRTPACRIASGLCSARNCRALMPIRTVTSAAQIASKVSVSWRANVTYVHRNQRAQTYSFASWTGSFCVPPLVRRPPHPEDCEGWQARHSSHSYSPPALFVVGDWRARLGSPFSGLSARTAGHSVSKKMS